MFDNLNSIKLCRNACTKAIGKMTQKTTISVIGLGYVGLPLALALSKTYPVIGYDQNEERIDELVNGVDRTAEVSPATLSNSTLKFTKAAKDLRSKDIFIIAVPTPVDADNRPDLTALKEASACVGRLVSRDAIVVVESTVFPGVTEDVCGPIIENNSGLKVGKEVFLGYSPERVNPGDSVHTVDKIVKVVAGQTQEVSEKLAKIYGSINEGRVFLARNIKTAEAAKVIENAQRDINIAFMNEVAQIFERLDISTCDVLDAANTKWNFLPFHPGLVGGHCIGVDPYYLAHIARECGIEPTVVLSGRATNDSMADYIAATILEKIDPNSEILVLGLTFKENVPDLRNSKVVEIIRELLNCGHKVSVHDPLADCEEASSLYGINLISEFAREYDCVFGCVAHSEYTDFKLGDVLRSGGWIFDLKGLWRNSSAISDFNYWSL